MKKLVLVIALMLNLSYLCAQEANIPCKIQKSEVFKDEYKNSTIVSVDEDDNGGVVVVRSYRGGMFNKGTHGYYFEHYNAGMNLVKEYELELDKGYVIGTIINKETVNIVEFNYVQKEKAYVCSVNTANINDFKFITFNYHAFKKLTEIVVLLNYICKNITHIFF